MIIIIIIIIIIVIIIIIIDISVYWVISEYILLQNILYTLVSTKSINGYFYNCYI